ncbi:MAG: hypothetical protein ACRYHQ_20300 [Janthinobacterium lividum]
MQRTQVDTVVDPRARARPRKLNGNYRPETWKRTLRWVRMTDPETLQLAGDDRFPNSSLPILVYRAALPADAAAFERAFDRQG